MIFFKDGLRIQSDVPHLDHSQLVLEVLQQVCHLGVAAQAGNGGGKNIAFLFHQTIIKSQLLINYKNSWMLEVHNVTPAQHMLFSQLSINTPLTPTVGTAEGWK